MRAEVRVLAWVWLLRRLPGPVALSKTHRLAEPPFLHQQNAAVETPKKSLQNLSRNTNVRSCFRLNF